MTDIIVSDKQANSNRHARINEQELAMMADLQRSEILVYIQIKMLCWKDGEKTDYTNAQFALATGVSEESVKRSISRLEELGRISRHTVMRAIKGVAKSHRWITLVPFQDALLGVTHDPQCDQAVLGVTSDPQCGQVAMGVTHDPQRVVEYELDVCSPVAFSGGSPMTPPGVTHDPQSLGVTDDPLLYKELKQEEEGGNTATQYSPLREKTKAVSSVSATHFLEDLTRQEITAKESSASVESFEQSASNPPPEDQSPAEDQSQSQTLVAAQLAAPRARPTTVDEDRRARLMQVQVESYVRNGLPKDHDPRRTGLKKIV
jgi:hypothetical protein